MEKHTGLWWTPHAPDHKSIGTLTIQNGGSPDLEVACQMGEAPGASLQALLQPRHHFASRARNLMVHGQSHSGEFFTLYDGAVPGFNLGLAPMTVATLRFNRGSKVLALMIRQRCLFPTYLCVRRAWMHGSGWIHSA